MGIRSYNIMYQTSKNEINEVYKELNNVLDVLNALNTLINDNNIDINKNLENIKKLIKDVKNVNDKINKLSLNYDELFKNQQSIIKEVNNINNLLNNIEEQINNINKIEQQIKNNEQQINNINIVLEKKQDILNDFNKSISCNTISCNYLNSRNIAWGGENIGIILGRKQNLLTPGDGIKIENNIISTTNNINNPVIFEQKTITLNELLLNSNITIQPISKNNILYIEYQNKEYIPFLVPKITLRAQIRPTSTVGENKILEGELFINCNNPNFMLCYLKSYEYISYIDESYTIFEIENGEQPLTITTIKNGAI